MSNISNLSIPSKVFLTKNQNCFDFTNFLCLQMWRAAYLLQQSLNGGNNCWNSKVSAHLNIFPSNRGVIKPYQASNPALSQKTSTINLKNNDWKKTLAQFWRRKKWFVLESATIFFFVFSTANHFIPDLITWLSTRNLIGSYFVWTFWPRNALLIKLPEL